MAINIVKAIDSGGTQYFPITHISAVRDSSGNTLDAILDGMGGGGAVPSGRTINTTNGITGGGDLSQDRTLSLASVTVNGYTGGALTSNTVSYDTYGRVSAAAPIVYSAMTVSSNQTNVTCPASITGSSNSGAQAIVVYVNGTTTTDYTISVTSSYKSPDGSQLNLTCAKNGYTEIGYLNINGTIYVRGV